MESVRLMGKMESMRLMGKMVNNQVPRAVHDACN